MWRKVRDKLERTARRRIASAFGWPAVRMTAVQPVAPAREYWELVEAFTMLFSTGAGGNAVIPEGHLRSICALLGIELSAYMNLTAEAIRTAPEFRRAKAQIFDALHTSSANETSVILRAFLHFVHDSDVDFECPPIITDDYRVCPWNCVLDVDDVPTFTFGQGSCVVVILTAGRRVVRIAHLPGFAVMDPASSRLLCDALTFQDPAPEIDEIIAVHYMGARAARVIAPLAETLGFKTRIIGINKPEQEQVSYCLSNADGDEPIRIMRNSRLIYNISPYDTGAAFLPIGELFPLDTTEGLLLTNT